MRPSANDYENYDKIGRFKVLNAKHFRKNCWNKKSIKAEEIQEHSIGRNSHRCAEIRTCMTKFAITDARNRAVSKRICSKQQKHIEAISTNEVMA